jgi:hypothetical protein
VSRAQLATGWVLNGTTQLEENMGGNIKESVISHVSLFRSFIIESIVFNLIYRQKQIPHGGVFRPSLKAIRSAQKFFGGTA